MENGAAVTDPFDLDRSRALYLALFGPIDGEVKGLKHLIFEPDGPMLQLPPYLLVASQPGIDAYKRRIAAANADEFDFTGVDWLGRGPRNVDLGRAAQLPRRPRDQPRRARPRPISGLAAMRSRPRGRSPRWPTSATGR